MECGVVLVCSLGPGGGRGVGFGLILRGLRGADDGCFVALPRAGPGRDPHSYKGLGS